MRDFNRFDKFDRFDKGGGAGSKTRTNCMLMEQHPTNADVIGYSSDFLNGGVNAYGNMIPDTTLDGIFIYSYEINHLSGDFTLKFGEDAVTQVPNSHQAVLYHFADDAGGNILLVWDDINKWYGATDVDKALALKPYLDTVVCMNATAIPLQLIYSNWDEMMVAI